MWLAASPTALHPDDVVAWLGRSPDRGSLERLRETIADVPDADWERDLLDALSQPNADARAALVNEQLTELDLRMQAWARVPRVCASLSTSFGILLGTLVLRNGLANAPDLSGELGELFVRDVLGDAMSVAAYGIAGTAFCIAAHAHARRMTRARVEAADRLIEKLESIVAPEPAVEGEASMARNPPPVAETEIDDAEAAESDARGRGENRK